MSLSWSQQRLVAGISVVLLIIRDNLAVLLNTQYVSIFLSPGQVPSAFMLSSLTAYRQLSLSLSSYYLFLFIFRTKQDKIQDLEIRTVSNFSGCLVIVVIRDVKVQEKCGSRKLSRLSSLTWKLSGQCVCVSILKLQVGRLHGALWRTRKNPHTWAYTFHLTPNTNHRCPDAHMQTDSQTYCRLFTFFFFFCNTYHYSALHTSPTHSLQARSQFLPHRVYFRGFDWLPNLQAALIGYLLFFFFASQIFSQLQMLSMGTHNNCSNQSDWMVKGCSPKRISPSRCFRGSNKRWGKRGGTGVNVVPVTQQISCCIQPRVPPDSDFILILWLTRARNPDCTH